MVHKSAFKPHLSSLDEDTTPLRSENGHGDKLKLVPHSSTAAQGHIASILLTGPSYLHVKTDRVEPAECAVGPKGFNYAQRDISAKFEEADVAAAAFSEAAALKSIGRDGLVDTSSVVAKVSIEAQMKKRAFLALERKAREKEIRAHLLKSQAYVIAHTQPYTESQRREESEFRKRRTYDWVLKVGEK